MRKSFRNQMPAGVLRVHEIEVRDPIDNPAVGLLGHVLVETAIARFHVIERDLHSLRHDPGDRTVGISQNQNRVRPDLGQHSLRFDQDVAQRTPQRGGVDAQVGIRRPQFQVAEEHLVELIIVILTGMD